MSGKKQQQSPWFTCSKCGQRLIKLYATKHSDLNCATIFPVIENGIAVSTTAKIPLSSKINQLPFIQTVINTFTLFLSDAIMQECKFQTFSWVMVKSVSPSDEEQSEDVTPNALQAWPIPDQQTSQNHPHVLLTIDAMTVNCFSNLSTPVSIQKLEVKSFCPAKQVTLSLCPNSDVDPNRFCENVKRKLKYRIIAEGNQFQIRYFSRVIKFKIKSIVGNAGYFSDDVLEDEFQNMNLSCDDSKSADMPRYFELVNETKFYLDSNRDAANDSTTKQVWTRNDIGGMDSCFNEIVLFLNYLFREPDYVAHGILIHGLAGTGKTILCEAICNDLKITPVYLREGEATENSEILFSAEKSAFSLEEAFSKALASEPAAVIIEGIELQAPAGSSAGAKVTKSTSFSYQLRTMIQRVKKSKVIVLATACDVDTVDPMLRSASIFGKEVETPVPSASQREEICTKILNFVKHNLTQDDIKDIALSTHGFVGADLRGLFTQAQINMSRQALDLHPDMQSEALSQSITMAHLRTALKTSHPSAMKSVLVDVPNVRWDDIGGQTDLKFKLKQSIEWPLKHPEAFIRLGITPPKGILMYGPPGCSKTMIAKAIATESGLNFISVKGSELFSKWVGESEKAVQKIFRKAKQVAPCVIFFDEIDSLGGERGSSGGSSNVHERVLAQLLVEIDGVEPLKEVTIVAATNRPDIIDQALLRPGRLDRIIYVPLPDSAAREEIFKIRFRKMPIAPDVDITELVESTDGYSGAEITAVCHEAALHALDESIDAKLIKQSHFIAALKTTKSRISKEEILFYETYSSSLKSV